MTTAGRLAGQHTEKQRLLQAVQTAALVQAALVHRGTGLTIHLRVTAAAGIRVPVTGFRLPVDRRAKRPVVLRLRGRFTGSWPARVSRYASPRRTGPPWKRSRPLPTSAPRPGRLESPSNTTPTPAAHWRTQKQTGTRPGGRCSSSWTRWTRWKTRNPH